MPNVNVRLDQHRTLSLSIKEDKLEIYLHDSYDETYNDKSISVNKELFDSLYKILNLEVAY